MKRERKQLQNWNFPKKVFGFFLFCFLIIYIQFAYLSLSPSIYGINMDEFASARNTYSTTLYAKRGTIYDSEGNTLALNVSSYTVIAYLSPSRTGSNSKPLHVVDVETTAKKLAPILNMSEEYIKKLLTKKAYQVELGPGGRGITEVVKEEIEAFEIPGMSNVCSISGKMAVQHFNSSGMLVRVTKGEAWFAYGETDYAFYAIGYMNCTSNTEKEDMLPYLKVSCSKFKEFEDVVEKNKNADLVGSMESQGTTPRRLTDLIGSLCDLTSGSGDKGTPVVYIQGYFDNYTSN